jgi:hypothetical protein
MALDFVSTKQYRSMGKSDRLIAPPILSLGLDGNESLASRPSRLTPEVVVAKRKIPTQLPVVELRFSTQKPINLLNYCDYILQVGIAQLVTSEAG